MSVLELTPFHLGIAIGVAAAVVAAVAWLIARSRKAKDQAVLLVGLPNSGKTALFFKLTGGIDIQSQTSMAPNQGIIPKTRAPPGARSQFVRLVDLPGHGRLRHFLNAHLPKAKAIVFVVDSVDFGNEPSAHAQLAYSLLTNYELVRRQVPLLIACNKRDSDVSMKPTAIKLRLEQEVSKICATSRDTMKEIGEDGEAAPVIPLGTVGEPFSFDRHTTLPLFWTESSVKADQLKELTAWIWSV
eukprot:TRINITY_DN94206_c0_g1_i1.p1 TRINITY_DN94206_c0_g1~~TRINITY_DN94206_c0_g1_i1.p1  ORF type:complete len:255 (-),score=39.18 TRINITY_DN94206_c0_g1_i1:20-748(-)